MKKLKQLLEILHVFNSRKGSISEAISGFSQKGRRATSKGNCVPCRFHNVGGVASLTLTSLSPCKQLVKQSPQPFAMLRTQPQPHKTNNLDEETQSWTAQHNDLPFIHFQFVRAPGHIIELVQHTVDHLWRLCWEMSSKFHSKAGLDSHALLCQLNTEFPSFPPSPTSVSPDLPMCCLNWQVQYPTSWWPRRSCNYCGHWGSSFLSSRTIALQTWHLSSPSSSSAMEESDWREAQDQSCEHLMRVVYTTRSRLNELRALTYWQCGCLDLWTRFSRPISLQNLVNVKHKFHELSSSLSVSCRSADRRIGGVPFFTFFVAPKLVGGNIRGNIRNWTQLQPLEILFPPHLQQQSHDFSLFGLLWREIVIIVTSEMTGFPQMFKSEPNPHDRLWMFRGLFPSVMSNKKMRQTWSRKRHLLVLAEYWASHQPTKERSTSNPAGLSEWSAAFAVSSRTPGPYILLSTMQNCAAGMQFCRRRTVGKHAKALFTAFCLL